MKVDTFFRPCFRCSLKEVCYPLKASYHMTKVLKDSIERQVGAGVTVHLNVTLKGCPKFSRKKKKEEKGNAN